MATGVVLHPLAVAQAKPLKAALKADFGLDASERDILSAIVYCATAPQVAGMLIAFTRAKAAFEAAGESSV